MSTGCLALVPLRSFENTKTRLSAVLDERGRSDLVKRLAVGVMVALTDWGGELAVVSDDPAVAAWCSTRSVRVIGPGVTGLSASVDAARRTASGEGYRHIAVVHADLMAPAALGEVIAAACEAGDRAVTAVPDRHGDGTNVLVVPTGAAFTFAYGPQSFPLHRAEAARAGLDFVVVDHDELSWDVDTPDDLRRYVGADSHNADSPSI